MVRANLDVAVSTHSESCENAAAFATVEHPGISNLIMTCEVQYLDFSVFIVVRYCISVP